MFWKSPEEAYLQITLLCYCRKNNCIFLLSKNHNIGLLFQGQISSGLRMARLIWCVIPHRHREKQAWPKQLRLYWERCTASHRRCLVLDDLSTSQLMNFAADTRPHRRPLSRRPPHGKYCVKQRFLVLDVFSSKMLSHDQRMYICISLSFYPAIRSIIVYYAIRQPQ